MAGSDTIAVPSKDDAKTIVGAAIRANDLVLARAVAEAARKAHAGYSMARLLLRVQLLQADEAGAASTFRSLRPADRAQFLAGMAAEEALPLLRVLAPTFGSVARAVLVLPGGAAALVPILRRAAGAEPPLAEAVLQGVLQAHEDGAPDALLVSVAFAFATGRPEDVFSPALLDTLADALGVAWPLSAIEERVAPLRALLPRRPIGGAFVERLAPFLARMLGEGSAPDPAWSVLSPLAPRAAELAGPAAVEAWLARHGDALTDAGLRSALSLPVLAAADPPAWRAAGIDLAEARQLARDGIWLPLLILLDQRGLASEAEDEAHLLRFNPAYARLRGIVIAAMAAATGTQERIGLLRTLAREGDLTTLRGAIAAHPDLLALEEGALLALAAVAGIREVPSALPPLDRLLLPLRSPRGIHRACRLLVAAGQEEVATRLVGALPDPEGDEVVALRLELLRSTGALAAWASLARTRMEALHANTAPALLREMRLWQDEERLAGAVGLVPEPNGDDALRALVRRQIFDRRFDDAAALAAGLARRSGQAADHYALVLALCQAERFPAALGAAAIAQAQFPAELRFPIKQAQVAEALLDFEQALHHWQVVGSLDTRSPQALAGTARSLLALGRHDALEALLRCLPDDAPDFLWTHNLRALSAARRGEDAAAAEAYAAGRQLAAGFVAEVRTMARRDGGMAWWNGAWYPHTRAEHARSLARFEDGFVARLAEPGRACIIVGNSPGLMENRLGEAIDGFGTVLRLNDFVTEGFEAFVGRRTDLWYSSGNRHARKHDLRAFDLAVIGASPAPMMPDLEPYGRLRLGLQLEASRACLLPPAYTALSEAAAYPKPTSGFRMILLAHYLCAEPVTIVGFDFFTRHKEHYFDQGTGRHKPGETHAGWFERAMVEEVLVPFAGLQPLAGTTCSANPNEA